MQPIFMRHPDRPADEAPIEAVNADQAEAFASVGWQQVAAPVPAKSASKATWVAFASDEARGETRLSADEADKLTRDQLIERYTPSSDDE